MTSLLIAAGIIIAPGCPSIPELTEKAMAIDQEYMLVKDSDPKDRTPVINGLVIRADSLINLVGRCYPDLLKDAEREFKTQDIKREAK